MAGRGMEVVFSEPMAVVVICGIKREKERPIGGEEREVKKKKKSLLPWRSHRQWRRSSLGILA